MSDSSPPPKTPDAPSDVLLLHSPTADGEGMRVLRARDGRIEEGELRPLKEGKPVVSGEVVRLTPRTESPAICDVAVQYRAPSAAAPAHKGPALVTSNEYRDHWDGIFGTAPAPTLLN